MIMQIMKVEKKKFAPKTPPSYLYNFVIRLGL